MLEPTITDAFMYSDLDTAYAISRIYGKTPLSKLTKVHKLFKNDGLSFELNKDGKADLTTRLYYSANAQLMELVASLISEAFGLDIQICEDFTFSTDQPNVRTIFQTYSPEYVEEIVKDLKLIDLSKSDRAEDIITWVKKYYFNMVTVASKLNPKYTDQFLEFKQLIENCTINDFCLSLESPMLNRNCGAMYIETVLDKIIVRHRSAVTYMVEFEGRTVPETIPLTLPIASGGYPAPNMRHKSLEDIVRLCCRGTIPMNVNLTVIGGERDTGNF